MSQQQTSPSPSDSRSTRTRQPPFPKAKYFISKENFHYEFSSSLPPVVTVEQETLIHIETNDCFHGRIQPSTTTTFWDEQQQQEIDTASAWDVLSNIPTASRNPVTGPVFVEGAKPGDVLAVTLLDIRPVGIGVACCGSTSGQLCHLMTKKKGQQHRDGLDATAMAAIRFFDLTEEEVICQAADATSRKRTMVTMRDNSSSSVDNGSGANPTNHSYRRLGPISFPASPMLGVIGVAPASSESDPIGTMPAGKHGGNLDNRANGIGSTIYLPVNHPGALLSIGDMHASQGDGEISGCGVEIGGHVLLSCRVWKHGELYPWNDRNGDLPILHPLEYPLTETDTHWMTHGVVVENIPEATRVACEEAAKILVGQWGFSIEEAFLFLSVQGDLGLCQSCHPDTGTQVAKMAVPKLPGVCPRPFRAIFEQSTKAATP